MQLAANPTADEMVLVVSDSNSHDTAYVWDGSGWGNKLTLATNNSDNCTDINVAYEQQSGAAMVVYGDNNADLRFCSWDGSWGSEQTLIRPGTVGGDVRWTTLASDPNSDSIALGVLTSSNEIWLSVWDGDGWDAPVRATANATTGNALNVAVAFESQSGNALATYGRFNELHHRTWNSGTRLWSGPSAPLDIGGDPHAMTLDADPASNSIMLSRPG